VTVVTGGNRDSWVVIRGSIHNPQPTTHCLSAQIPFRTQKIVASYPMAGASWNCGKADSGSETSQNAEEAGKWLYSNNYI
jgi:hypothetical protein